MRFTACINSFVSKAALLDSAAACLFCALVIFCVPAAASAQAASILVHDNTKGGGSKVAEAFKAELLKQFPCVETFDDADINDAIQDEREKEMLEGTDPSEVLKKIGERIGSSLVLTINATPAAGGTVYTASVADISKNRMLAREAATSDGDIERMVQSLIRQIGPQLASKCKPHWIGTVRYTAKLEQTRITDDEKITRAMVRNVKRHVTETMSMITVIKAVLLPPDSDDDVTAPKARVTHRVSFTGSKEVSASGEMECREPGKNRYWDGYSESWSEKTTQIGQGNDTMPVIISVEEDGKYSISVTAPGGPMISSIVTTRSLSGCGKTDKPEPDSKSLPPGQISPTSFEAGGKVDPRNRDVLAGSRTLPGGNITISWDLRLVKPKGK